MKLRRKIWTDFCERNKIRESDWETKRFVYDGLIYMMVDQHVDEVIPFYIGKAETLGKDNGNISANIKGIERDTSKFARWSDNYAYHIGDYRAFVLPGHDPIYVKQKHVMWASFLFESFPTPTPVLKRRVYFWAKAWSGSEVGAWEDFGPTRLTLLEYQLIGPASSAFGDFLHWGCKANENLKYDVL